MCHDQLLIDCCFLLTDFCCCFLVLHYCKHMRLSCALNHLLTYSVLPVLDTTGRRRVKKAVVWVAQLVAALITVQTLCASRFMACCPSFRMCMASLIHLVKRSGSLSITVAWDQLITWFSWVAWSVRADLLCSVKLDARRLLVNESIQRDFNEILWMTPVNHGRLRLISGAIRIIFWMQYPYPDFTQIIGYGGFWWNLVQRWRLRQRSAE